MTRLEVFVNLGYRRDPFLGVRFETGDAARVRRIVTMAVESRAMVSIVGPRGVGKTNSVDAALKKMGAKIVTVEKSDKGRVTIGDIEMAMVFDLSNEEPKGGERLGRQVRPVLGEAFNDGKGKVVLVIEESQRLHANTLRSLKTLREKKWKGESELFSVVLVGQSDPMARAGLSEVKLRTDTVFMQGLSSAEAAGYVKSILGKHFEDAAIEELAEIPAARNFLELQETCVAVLSHALTAGREVATVEDVREVAADRQAMLPKTAGRQAARTVTAKDALKSVLGKRAGDATDGKEVAAC